MNTALGLCCAAGVTLLVAGLTLPACIDTGCEKTLTCPVVSAAATSGSGAASMGGGGAADEGGAGGVPPGCGNNIVEPPEECDDGPMNGAGHACRENCILNVCGDSYQGPDEGCDEGPNNGLALGLCAPDCSRIIERKYIVPSATAEPNAILAPNVVATADSHCPPGYKAMIAYSASRRATVIANTLTNPVDWVLRPYTYYYNEDENPVWLTRDVALLGVDNGSLVGLENPIRPFDWPVFQITGMNADWTTLSSGTENCYGWTNGNSSVTASYGWAGATDGWFLKYTGATVTCSQEAQFYCVEQ